MSIWMAVGEFPRASGDRIFLALEISHDIGFVFRPRFHVHYIKCLMLPSPFVIGITELYEAIGTTKLPLNFSDSTV